MPRIRYKKDPNFTLFEEDSEDDQRENASGNSWLSNAVIASQLSDAKIKTTINALKAQITILEAELLSRRLNGSNKNGKNWNNIGRLCPRKDEERLYPRIIRKPSKRNTAQFKKVASLRKTLAKLGVKDIDALLTEWSKITEGTK